MNADVYALNRRERLRVSVRRLAGTRYPILVVDDVYRDPEAVRALALSLEYSPSTSGHPGDKALAEVGDGLEALHELVYRYLGRDYGYESPALPTPSDGHARFHRMHDEGAQLSPRQCMPHVDTALLAGVVYLNLPEHCRGGTAFHRHRRHGLVEYRLRDRQPVDPNVIRAVQQMGIMESYLQGLEQQHWDDYDELGGQLWSPSSAPQDFMERGNPDWERFQVIPMRWNRMVCYPGFVFHSALYSPAWFDMAAASRRLTQNLFFMWPRATS